jgi:hypothetical protein
MSDPDEVRLHRLSAPSPRRGARDSDDRSHTRRLIGRALMHATYTVLGLAHRTQSPCMEATKVVRPAP